MILSLTTSLDEGPLFVDPSFTHFLYTVTNHNQSSNGLLGKFTTKDTILSLQVFARQLNQLINMMLRIDDSSPHSLLSNRPQRWYMIKFMMIAFITSYIMKSWFINFMYSSSSCYHVYNNSSLSLLFMYLFIFLFHGIKSF